MAIIEQSGAKPPLDQQFIEAFNDKFFNPEYYSSNPTSRFLLTNDYNPEDDNILFRDMMRFCMNTDVCKMFNVSIFDLWSKLDFGTYTVMKEMVVAENKRKEEILTKSQKDLATK